MHRITAWTTALLVVGAGLTLPAQAGAAESAPQPGARPAATSRVAPALKPAAAAPFTGTPKTFLAETPVVRPLTTGYVPGLYQPTGGLVAKDRRGCSYRNRTLIALAVKKPRVGARCTLTGGAWRADFGSRTITDARKLQIGKLVPDKVAYAQGGFAWTPAQRTAYVNPKPVPARKMRALAPLDLPTSDVQVFTTSVSLYMKIVNKVQDTYIDSPEDLQKQLAALRAKNPDIFDSWTVATLLNAKSWGLSLSPGSAGSMSVTIDACALKSRASDPGIKFRANAPEETENPCTAQYSVPNEALAYGISAVPTGASSDLPLDNTVLNKYGTPTGPEITRYMFGIHAPAQWESDGPTGYNGPITEASFPNVPVGNVRLWDTETAWADIEPNKGAYDFSKLSKQIELAQRLDSRVLLVLGGTPKWASEAGKRSSVPSSVADYKAYVSAVACKFGQSITAYEVWNEANIKEFWEGSPAQMADLTQAAFEAVRACNPSALVVAASTTTRAIGAFSSFYPAYLNELKARNWPIDAYSVHSYPLASGNANTRLEGISQFKAMLALAGAPHTKIFDTETNYGLAGMGEGKVPYKGDVAMTLISRTFIDSARFGFDSTFWFLWTRAYDDKYGIQLNPTTSDEQQAWRQTYDWLVGSRFQRCFFAQGNGPFDSALTTVCQFSRGSENFSIVWRAGVFPGTGISGTKAFTGLGSRLCTLRAVCMDLATTSGTDISAMPVRIDGPPLDGGPVAGNSPGIPVTETPMQPTIVSVDVDYGVSNKADGVATWTGPINSWQSDVKNYTYLWQFKKGNELVRVASGTTRSRTAKADLNMGPGTYVFSVKAVGARATSAFATMEFTYLRSDAAPPSLVTLKVTDGQGTVTWERPQIRSSLVQGYEVDVLNADAKTWVPLASAAAGPTLNFTDAKVNLADGQTITARVRTVLKSGAKSIYETSDPLLIGPQLPAPTITKVTVLTGLGTYLLTVPGRNLVPEPMYPQGAIQVEISHDGVTWRPMTFGPTQPTEATAVRDPDKTRLPYGLIAISPVDGLGMFSGTKVRVRAVGGPGVEPSPWVEYPTPIT